MRASVQRLGTEWMRRLDLALMAGRSSRHGLSTRRSCKPGCRSCKGLLDDLAEVDAAEEPPLAENRMLRHGIERIFTQLVELATAINEHVVVPACSASPPPIGSPSALPRNVA